MSLALPHDEPLADFAREYWRQTRRPLACLAFILPLLICYEVGVVTLGVQNGADAWMRRWLNLLGFSQHFLLPALTVGILLAWHHVTREPWTVPRRVLGWMLGECCLWAVVIWIVYCLECWSFQIARRPIEAPLRERLCEAVGYFGAGVYEELLFRMVGLMAVLGGLRLCGLGPATALCAAAVGTSLAFSAAHYLGAYGDPFDPFSFTFRFTAGVIFSGVFVYRGFGIAAGAHAAYDILVGVLLARF